VLLPVIAPLASKSSDDVVRLGRTTVWQDDPEYGQLPVGQKLMLFGDEELPFLEIRKLTFDHAGERAESATA
jgi:protein involved in temperature-dependent protein secretion